MGYYTYFQLEITGQPIDDQVLADDFQQITGYDFDILGSDSIKWYDCESNMRDLSKLHPSTIFHLYGDGEDSEDKWYAVYCNGEGRQVYAEVTYPKIDIHSIGGIGERHPEFFI